LSIVDGGIAADVELNGIRVGGRCCRNASRWIFYSRKFLRRKCRAFDPAVVQRLAPELVEIRAGVLLLPVCANQIVARGIGLAGEQRDKFQRTLAAVERRNQWLNNADGSVVSTRVTPGFEFVCLIDVPLTKLGSFVLIEAEVHTQRNFVALQNICESKIGWRIVGWVAAENDQQIDPPYLDGGNQILDRFELVDGIRVDRITVENCLANVALLCVDRMNQSVNQRRLVIPGDEQA